jgi:hypothetical protein
VYRPNGLTIYLLLLLTIKWRAQHEPFKRYQM